MKNLKTQWSGRKDIEINFWGDWEKLDNLLNSKNPQIQSVCFVGMEKFAKRYKKLLKFHITTGGKAFGYPPLKNSYIENKERLGYVTTMFNLTRSLWGAITIKVNKRENNIGVGIDSKQKKNTIKKGVANTLTISQYAQLLQEGTKYEPKRPIFTDVFKRIGGKEAIGIQIVKELINHYKI